MEECNIGTENIFEKESKCEKDKKIWMCAK